MSNSRTYSLTAGHVDPGTRMGEILFGLVMTLTFTLGAGLIIEEEGREGARQLLIATIGCNLAWGLIDGVFYILGEVFERGRLRRIALSIGSATSDAQARELVAREFDGLIAPVTDEPVRDKLYASIAQRLKATPLAPNRFQAADFIGGLASGWLVFACSVPAALPFLVIDDPRLALRVSNAVLLALLFIVGYRGAKLTTANPWLTGGIFLLVGAILVVITIALGG